MERVLDVYKRPYNADFPVVCMDEDHWWCILVAIFGAFLFTEIGAVVITDYIYFILKMLTFKIMNI
jgi:hypothetical protein